MARMQFTSCCRAFAMTGCGSHGCFLCSLNRRIALFSNIFNPFSTHFQEKIYGKDRRKLVDGFSYFDRGEMTKIRTRKAGRSRFRVASA